MNKPRLLDLYCCQGGAARGYANAGFAPYGIDIEVQPNYPYPFLKMDAITALGLLMEGRQLVFTAPDGTTEQLGVDDLTAIHASPPCQSFLNLGALNRALGRDYNYPDLIAPTRVAIAEIGLAYVIENVETARSALISPVRICGTGLGLPIRRHRLFESSFSTITGIDCAHTAYAEPKYWTSWRPRGEHRLSTVVQVYGNAGGQEEWPAAMGIDWMDRRGFVEAIPPAYTEHIGRQMLAHIRVAT